MTNSALTIIVISFVLIVCFGFWAIHQMGNASEIAEELATEGREKLKKAHSNSLNSSAEINRLNKTIEQLKRSKTQGGMPNNELEILSRKHAMQILELKEGFSQVELKKQHRTLAKKIHPDVKGSTGLFIVLNSAYELLKH